MPTLSLRLLLPIVSLRGIVSSALFSQDEPPSTTPRLPRAPISAGPHSTGGPPSAGSRSQGEHSLLEEENGVLGLFTSSRRFGGSVGIFAAPHRDATVATYTAN